MKSRHRLLMLVLAVVVWGWLVFTPGERSSLALGDIIYVDPDATGDETGESWIDAYGDLSFAIIEAMPGDQIWVAEGYYKPNRLLDPDDPRSATIILKNGVAIYGGFDPDTGAVDFADRDWIANVVLISGDRIGNDQPGFVNYSDNFYHIFYHPEGLNLNNTAILDGVTIYGGSASDLLGGGGMVNLGSSPTIRNTIFTGNLAAGMGGGMLNAGSSPVLVNVTFDGNKAATGGGMVNGASSPTITDCSFTNNIATEGGGMRNESNSTPVLTNCAFTGNTADFGGGMYNYDSFPTLDTCTFTGNTAEYGGGMYNLRGSPSLNNCTFSANTAVFSGGGMWNHNATPVLTGCTFSGNSAGSLGGGMLNDLYSDAVLIDCTFQENSAGDQGGGMLNGGSSPVLSGCTFSGNTADYGGGMSNHNGTSSTALNNCTFTDNSAEIDGGGMYNYQGSSPTLNTVIFSGNSAGVHGGGMANILSYYIPTVTTMTDCTFSGNTAAAGGGMYNDESGPILIGCAFTENTASQSGGGMYSEGSSGSHMTACTFSGNTAAVSGGGIYQASGSLTLINSSFTGNTASLGGGIFNTDASPILDYCTFTGNSAEHGSGIYNRGASWVAVVNTILWGDALDEVFNEGGDSVTDISYSDVQGGYSGASIIDADPRFMDPLNGDLHLLPGSPCIDAGINDGPLNISHDFESDPRKLDGNGDGIATVDMGVDEVVTVHYFIRLPLVLR